MQRLRQIAVVGLLAAALAGPVAAEVPLADCAAAVGTFLVRNSLPDGEGGVMQTRSLITLSAEGLATRTSFDLPQAILAALLDDFVLVTDDELYAAMRLLLVEGHQPPAIAVSNNNSVLASASAVCGNMMQNSSPP